MAAKKPNDKLSKLDKRIASVAPGKKYSDLTPAEKRKYDTNTARYVAELEKQKTGSAKKSSKETVKAASAKGSGKPKYQNVDKARRENTKERNVKTVEKTKNILGKNVTKQEKRSIGNKTPNIPKMVDREAKEKKGQRTEKPSTKKVPVKVRGGMRGGMGGGVLNINDLIR